MMITINEILNNIVIFLAVFSALSLFRLLINFIRALLSNPPKPLQLNRSALIYYGICLTYLITLLIK